MKEKMLKMEQLLEEKTRSQKPVTKGDLLELHGCYVTRYLVRVHKWSEMVRVKKPKLAKGDRSSWTNFGNKSGLGDQFW